jgi:tyrosyl-tRNA synthetase
MTADGKKMGKTEKGAVWLDPERTSSHEYYQFWINTDDRDVRRFLALFTFLPMDEVERLGSMKGADLREAKETLAIEATGLIHGKEEARKAREASRRLFGWKGSVKTPTPEVEGTLSIDAVPTTYVDREKYSNGLPAFKLFEITGLCSSSSEARRLIEQGGAYIDNERIERFDVVINLRDEILLRAGKKKFHRIKIA